MNDVVPGSEGQNAEILLEVSAQLEKDFARAAIDLVLSEADKSSIQHLQAKVADEIARLCRNEPARLPQLAYSIDIPEQNPLLGSACDKKDEFAALLVDREIYKVVNRKLYSKRFVKGT